MSTVGDPPGSVVISEIMYHPSSELIEEEFIEIFNPGATAVDLDGWRISRGVDFTFDNITLNGGEYLVIAADVAAFNAKYPTVTNIVGGWTGRLSNSSESVELEDELGSRIDEVTYADEGDWAIRERGEVDAGHQGWRWAALHDGEGRSLELINAAITNDHGRNWSSSLVAEGTPGVANSVAIADIAPLITDVKHRTIVPTSTDTVTVTAVVQDELANGLTVTLFHRNDGDANFTAVQMFDDGLHGDGAAGDNEFGGMIPPQPDGTIVEFYVQAEDAGGLIRTWPAPADTIAGPGESFENVANALYQVDDSFALLQPGDQTVLKLIMTAAEAAELADIGEGTRAEAESNAQMNATFISIDGVDVKARYTVGIRNRGNGSRVGPPNNYRINFRSDNTWKGVNALNINNRFSYSQLIGSKIIQRAGIAVADATDIQLRVNNQDLSSQGTLQFGSYVAVEAQNSDFTDGHFPGDGGGNLYRVRDANAADEGDLKFEGFDPDAYRDTYFKATNEAEDDWDDLIHLVDVLNNTSDADYFDAVSTVVNIEQWMRYIALDSLLGNLEGGLNRGQGDDFAIYSGVNDPRFVLVPHDLDTIMDMGDRAAEPNRDIFSYTDNPGLSRFLTHPDFVPLYYTAFLELIEQVFNPTVLDPLIDQFLAPLVPANIVTDVKQFVIDRTNGVLAQIPREFTVDSSHPIVNGFHRTISGEASVDGTFDAATTRSVTVNGLLAEIDPIAGTWAIAPNSGGQTEILVGRGSNWLYLDDGSNQGTAWREAQFDDSTWEIGDAQLGYGDGDEVETVDFIDTDPGTSGTQKNITTYFRRYFNVDDPSAYVGLTAHVLRDDGVAVFLNGNRIVLDNLPDGANFDTEADDTIGGNDEDTFFQFVMNANDLVVGENVLAVEIHQANDTSSDISFDLELEAELVGTSSGVPLNPGINRLLVQAFHGKGGTGNVVNSGHVDVWFDDGSVIDVSGELEQTLPLAANALQVSARDTYQTGVPILVRLELHDGAGRIDRNIWDATATLSTSTPGMTLSVSEVQLFNGLGSALVTFNGTPPSGAVELTASIGGQQFTQSITNTTGQPVTQVSGTLAGTESTWSGIVHVTGDVLVPTGHTLNIEAGTLVLVDGVVSGSGGFDIDVQGNVQALGTAEKPITFTASNPAMAWGEIHHDNAASSLYRFVNITRAGNSPAGGHTNTGPALRPVGSQITFENCNITDLEGKIAQATGGGDLIFRDCLFARAVMGPEIENTALLFERNWITQMNGVDDNDGIYIHSQGAGQTVSLSGGVLAQTDDDGIDTLGATISVTNYIVRDTFDKGVSTFGGQTDISRSLIVSDDIGISTKEEGTDTSVVNLDHVTVVATNIGIQAEDKTGQPNVLLEYFITNSIISAADPVRTDYDPADIHIDFSNVVGEVWPSSGGNSANLSADPRFIDPIAHDYRLRSNSPSIDAGDPAAATDIDGTTADQGAFTFVQSTLPGGTITEEVTLIATNGPYRITGDIVVADGATLLIEAGAVLEFNSNTGITVNGRLVAAGQLGSRIQMILAPGESSDWDGLAFENSLNDSQLRFVDMADGDGQGEAILVDHAQLLIDGMTWSGMSGTILELDHPSLLVRYSTFPGAQNGETIHGENIAGQEYLILNGNTFEFSTSGDDIIDFTNAERPGPVFQVLNNVFLGGGDDGIDLDGTDAHVEGNVFMNFHKNTSRTTTSNALATGEPQSGGSNRTEVFVARNVFIDNDHHVLLKEDAFLVAENNVFIDSSIAAIQFNEVGGTSVNGPGLGAILDGNIFLNNADMFINIEPGTTLEMNHSIAPVATHGFGVGNLDGDPLFVDAANGNYALQAGSPAIGTGPNGLDMGVEVAVGASISGEPVGTTDQTAATLMIDGPGITAYRFALDDGAFGVETDIDVPITLNGLADGDHFVRVIGKNSAGVWQSEDDAAISGTWTVDTVGGFAPLLASLDAPQALTINTVIWSASQGPFRVTADVTVPADTTLIIEPGTNVFFDAGTQMTVLGQLVAEGNAFEQIRFTRTPGDSGTWDGIHFQNTDEDNRISFAVIEHARSNSGMVGVTDSTLTIENSTFDHSDRRRIEIDNANLTVRNSIFEEIFAPGVAPTSDNLSEHIHGSNTEAGRQLIIEGNTFGHVTGHNDLIDVDNLTGDTVAQILGNTFLGGGDDALDITGDFYIEGNTFESFHKDQFNVDLGQSNVISASTGQFTVVRNTFADIDHAMLVKGGSFATFTNNTVFDSSFAVLYFDLPGQTSGPGLGAIVESSLFANITELLAEVGPGVQVEVNRSVVPTASLDQGVGNTDEDPRLVDPSNGNFAVAAGSPAIGTGLHGLDRGALVPPGVTLGGGPTTLTAQAVATFDVAGPNITHYRVAVDGGAFGGELAVGVAIELSGLSDGVHAVSVIGKNAAGIWQDEADAATRTWTVDTTTPRLLINEVLAVNGGVFDNAGTRPDVIELINAGGVAINLAGMSLSDVFEQPTKFVFGANTFLNPGETLLLLADDNPFTPGTHLGFSLAGQGEAVYLFDTVANGGGLIDTVEFGLQVADLSISRVGPDQTFALTTPTLGAANGDVHRLGGAAQISINEWGTNGNARYFEDFIELYNADDLPVSLAGLFITDDPVARPDRYALKPLSFVAPTGFVSLDANNDVQPVGEADELPFLLSADLGMMALFDLDGREIDHVSYGPQFEDVSQGRFVDGSSDADGFQFFFLPTPGAANTIDVPPNPAAFDTLKITELMYSPLEGSDFEFVEFLNISNETISLIGVAFNDGITFNFGTSDVTALAAGERVVIVNNKNAFESKYGSLVNVAGEYEGNLSNGGEHLNVIDINNAAIADFTYDNAAGWPTTPDGGGPSLELIDLQDAYSDPSNWRASFANGGSPGTDSVLDTTPPTILSIVENQGSGQRSMYKHIAIQFSEAVQINPVAMQLENLTTGQMVDGANLNMAYDPVTHIATWTFPGLTGSSLVDGNYEATLVGALVQDTAGLILDGDGNGSAGGDMTMSFWRYYGDINGDRAVDPTDLFQFRSAFGIASGNAGYEPHFDFDADGNVGGTDLFQFRQRVFTELDPPVAGLSSPPTQQPLHQLNAPMPADSIDNIIHSDESAIAPTLLNTNEAVDADVTPIETLLVAATQMPLQSISTNQVKKPERVAGLWMDTVSTVEDGAANSLLTHWLNERKHADKSGRFNSRR